MNYFFIALLTTTGTAIVLYFLMNKVLHIKIRIIPLVLCVACSLFVSITLPKVILRYTDWIGTLAVLSVFSIIFAYFLAYYEGNFDVQQADPEPQVCFSESMDHNDLSLPVFIDYQNTPGHETTPEPVGCLLEAESIPPPTCFLEAQTAPILETNILDSLLVPKALDEQLELAFHLKEQQYFSSAATLFQSVLTENPNSEAAPLIILQIADSLKSAKKYQQALDILAECGGLSSQYDTEIKRQFYELLIELQQLHDSENTGGL